MSSRSRVVLSSLLTLAAVSAASVAIYATSSGPGESEASAAASKAGKSASGSGCALCSACSSGSATTAAGLPAPLPYDVFLDPQQVYDLTKVHTVGEDLILIDARSAEKFAAGHLPGAINLPPETLRTPKAKPGAGYSQYLFRIGDDYVSGDLDVDRYAAILGGAGIDATDAVVVYGNHAGKADGSVPAMVLDLLGHQGPVHFLQGVGFERWQDAGFEVSTQATPLPPTDYLAKPRADALWNLDDIQAHLEAGTPGVVFYDTRSLAEFTGENPRSNARGGHIPGAIRIDYADLMDADRSVRAAHAIAQAHAEAGLTPDKTLVLYCQTSTRISLPWLALRQLGYENLAIYDASMHEYLNRDDTVIATGSGG